MNRNPILLLRKRLVRMTLVIVGLLAILPQSSNAQSLWKQRLSRQAFLFYDTNARQVGDILTVFIQEATDVQNRDQRAMDRGAVSNGGFSLTGALAGNLGTKEGSANLTTNANGTGEFDGSSSYTVQRGFVDRVSVRVMNRLPNGNLVIHGTRDIVVSGERRFLCISGVIRPIDIRSDNSIESQFIADFRVRYKGDGIESRFTEQGWATRAWNKYRPL